MSHRKILFIIMSFIIVIVLFALGIGFLTAFIKNKFGNSILWGTLILIFILSCLYLVASEIKEKKELKRKKLQYLDLGKLLFKNYENEFEAFYTHYLHENDKNGKPIVILHEFADDRGLTLIIDCPGEENEGEIEDFISSKTDIAIAWVKTKKLREKITNDEVRNGKFIIELFKSIDMDLKALNKKLLFFSLGNDSYIFTLTDIATFREVIKIGNSDFHGTEKL